jgi:hypothetical protein
MERTYEEFLRAVKEDYSKGRSKELVEEAFSDPDVLEILEGDYKSWASGDDSFHRYCKGDDGGFYGRVQASSYNVFMCCG